VQTRIVPLLLRLLVLLAAATGSAQVGGRDPVPGDPAPGDATYLDAEHPVTATGELRLWRAHSTAGGRVMLKVWRPEGDRLVVVGASALEVVPPGTTSTFSCRIPVARGDLIGCSCPDATCVDRFPDGLALVAQGDLGTAPAGAFAAEDGTPALAASGTPLLDVPSAASPDLVVPVAARTSGLNGTRWQTTLEIFNTAVSATTVALFFNLSNVDNTTPAGSAQLVIPPRSVLTLADVVGELFALDEVTGSLDLVSSAPILAHARIANLGGGGTFGQHVPAVPASWAVGDDDAPGLAPNADVVQLFEVREDGSWRTNLGVVNVAATPLEVELRALQGAVLVGNPLTLRLAPFSHTQLTRILDVMAVPRGAGGVRLAVAAAPGTGGRLLAYASRVDNATGDAVFLPAATEPALP
jgi:hypothetical protein